MSPFEAWMALALPWVLPDAPIWRSKKTAFEAGYQAGYADGRKAEKEARND